MEQHGRQLNKFYSNPETMVVITICGNNAVAHNLGLFSQGDSSHDLSLYKNKK